MKKSRIKKTYLVLTMSFLNLIVNAQDWKDITVPANPGQGKVWQIQDDISDDFNYNFEATSTSATIGEKWTNFYHNAWTGPQPTVWKRNHVYVEDGAMKIKASKGADITFSSGGQSYTMPATNLGCATSTKQVQYPVYIETRVKIMKSVLASDVWLLSSDDTQEIDICEAYGGNRWTNDWFSNKRLHLSHHVFIRSPFQDWQPNDEGSFYTDGSTIWSDGYHRIGVYWKDPWNLEYYVDGKLVRTRSGVEQIDPKGYTNGTGLSKPMDIIINTEDQTWRAIQGLTPTNEEMANAENNTFKVDWVRVYKPVDGEVGSVTGVSLDKKNVESYAGASVQLTASVTPNNAPDVSVAWKSDNSTVATVNENGLVQCIADGLANIVVTTNDGGKTDTCKITVSGIMQVAFVEFDNDNKYLDTNFTVGDKLTVSCNFNAGSGNTINTGIKFWLREIKPGWAVAKDYTAWDYSVAGKESGVASAVISLKNVPATNEIPASNWYFLYVTFSNSAGKNVDKGIYPINIVRTTAVNNPKKNGLRVYPNPVKDKLQVSSEYEMKQITLYQLDGKLVQQAFPRNKQEITHLETLNSGVFFLKVQYENDEWDTIKIIKQ